MKLYLSVLFKRLHELKKLHKTIKIKYHTKIFLTDTENVLVPFNSNQEINYGENELDCNLEQTSFSAESIDQNTRSSAAKRSTSVTFINESISHRPGRPAGSSIKQNSENLISSDSTLKRKRQTLYDKMSMNDVILCAKKKFLEANNQYAVKLLELIKDPERAQHIFELVNKACSKKSFLHPQEALALFSFARLTKETYTSVREIFSNQQCNAFPSYRKVIL